MDGKQRFVESLHYVESRQPAQGFVLGERYSFCGVYLTVFFLWARRLELELGDLPRYSGLANSVLMRPAVRRALEQEGFGHLYQA